ncbi:MAG TPA: hypothetical protein VGM05_01850 [Planctomycetaceae bacterium]|jgi:hypothetical protein
MTKLTDYHYSLRTDREIAEFVRQNNVELPAELRAFLRTLRPGEPQFHWELLDYGYFPIWSDKPSAEFQWDNEDAEIAIVKRLGSDHGFMWDGELDFEHRGFITLASQGCGWMDVLVITGEQRGMVWGGGNLCWFPFHDESGRQFGFCDWYEKIEIPSREWRKKHDEEAKNPKPKPSRNDDQLPGDEFYPFPVYQRNRIRG